MEKQLSFIKQIGNWVSAILLGNTRETIARIDERTLLMLEDLKDIKPKVNDMWPKMDILWKDEVAPARSPRQLNELGNKILNESGIKEIVENKKVKLLEAVRILKPENPYDAEKVILSVVAELPKHCPEVVDELKNGAFKVGQNLDTVLLVGGFHLRNQIFPELGFSLTDLDRPESFPQEPLP